MRGLYFFTLVLLFIQAETTQAQSTTCVPGMVENANGDMWTEECYLNNDCMEQGNPCQANDVNLLGVFLADSTGNPLPACDVGTTSTVTLWGRFLNGTNSSRYAVRTRTEIWIEGAFHVELIDCSFDTLLPGTISGALLGSFTYTCGDQISLLNTWIGWEASSAVCEDPNDPNYISMCNDYPPSKCSKELDFIDFLSPNFDFGCVFQDVDSTVVSFQNLTLGGTPPLTYLWDFGDGNTSTEINPSHTYLATTGSFTVELTATDSNGVVAGAIITLVLEDLLCCELAITCPPDTLI